LTRLMPFLTPRLTRFLTRILDSLTLGLAKRAAGLTPLLTFTFLPFRLAIRRQTRLITNTMVGRRESQLTYFASGSRQVLAIRRR
jgi:hypothetical protein